MESYVVHTNYDEYAIFLTKKFSRHHGTTITAKLYGKGLNKEAVGAGAGRDCGEGAGSLLFLGARTLVRETQGVLALRKKSSASLVRQISHFVSRRDSWGPMKPNWHS